MLNFVKENINGILGTVIFHLVLIIIIMATRLSTNEFRSEESILVQFQQDISEEEFRQLTESLMERSALMEESGRRQSLRNLAVNIAENRPVADQFREMSPEQMADLDRRMQEILSNAANGIMPELDKPEFEFEPAEIIRSKEDENDEPYSGPTTITYDLPGRRHLRIPVPVYKCPGGGTAEVSIAVNRQGQVVSADIKAKAGTFNEKCIFDMALEAALESRFDQNPGAPPVQNGTITFYFQEQ
jgi:hypothetical protein